MTDGELRRASWHMDFIYQLDGVTKEAGHLSVSSTTRTATSSSRRPRCMSTASSGFPTIFGDDFGFLRETVETGIPKLTIPSPSMVHYRGGRAAIDARSTPTWTRSGPT